MADIMKFQLDVIITPRAGPGPRRAFLTSYLGRADDMACSNSPPPRRALLLLHQKMEEKERGKRFKRRKGA